MSFVGISSSTPLYVYDVFSGRHKSHAICIIVSAFPQKIIPKWFPDLL